jgi:hypothetical protein
VLVGLAIDSIVWYPDVVIVRIGAVRRTRLPHKAASVRLPDILVSPADLNVAVGEANEEENDRTVCGIKIAVDV